jgi:hypothetical protein
LAYWLLSAAAQPEFLAVPAEVQLLLRADARAA